MADRHHFATHGYAPLSSPNPVREDELAELQAHDAETITDTQMVTDLCRQLSASAHAGEKLDLLPLESALGHLSSRLDARKALT